MSDVAALTVSVLEPYVGAIVAKTCVRSAAERCGKLPEQLTAEDMPTLLASVRAFLVQIAPEETVASLIGRIERSA